MVAGFTQNYSVFEAQQKISLSSTVGRSIIEISYSILIFIKSIIFFIFDSFCLLFVKKQTTHQIVLLIRQDTIGDFVLWLDTAKEYRKLYPSGNYKIVLVGNALWCDLARDLSLEKQKTIQLNY